MVQRDYTSTIRQIWQTLSRPMLSIWALLLAIVTLHGEAAPVTAPSSTTYCLFDNPLGIPALTCEAGYTCVKSPFHGSTSSLTWHGACFQASCIKMFARADHRCDPWTKWKGRPDSCNAGHVCSYELGTNCPSCDPPTFSGDVVGDPTCVPIQCLSQGAGSFLYSGMPGMCDSNEFGNKCSSSATDPGVCRTLQPDGVCQPSAAKYPDVWCERNVEQTCDPAATLPSDPKNCCAPPYQCEATTKTCLPAACSADTDDDCKVNATSTNDPRACCFRPACLVLVFSAACSTGFSRL